MVTLVLATTGSSGDNGSAGTGAGAGAGAGSAVNLGRLHVDGTNLLTSSRQNCSSTKQSEHHQR